VTIILIHKPTNSKIVANIDAMVPPLRVLFNMILEMAQRLEEIGVDMRTSSRDDFNIVDDLGKEFNWVERDKEQNVHSFDFHFG